MKTLYDPQWRSPKEELEYLLDRLNNSTGTLTKDDCDRIEAITKLLNEKNPEISIIKFVEREK